MPVTLNKLRSQTRTIPVPFGDETINVTYRLSVYSTRESLETQRYQREMQRKTAAGEVTSEDDEAMMDWLIAQAIRLIESWDIVTDEKSGEMFPITEENLWQLDPALLNSIIVEIGKDKSPNGTAAAS